MNKDNLATCTECTIEYDWTLPGESLTGDLNFCNNKCADIWLAKAERKSGVYLVTTKEWCDKILADVDWLDEPASPEMLEAFKKAVDDPGEEF